MTLQWSTAVAVGLLIAASLSGPCLADGDWDYKNYGPSRWAALYPQFCAGDKQSPIDLNTQTSTQEPLIKKYVFHQSVIADAVKLRLENDGHKIELNWSPGLNITMGLTATDQMYKAAQLHWHWGGVSTQGSEHTVDKKSYAAEGHLVFYNAKDYASIGDAVNKPNGLAVLGVFYELSTTNDPLLSTLDKALSNDSLVAKGGVAEVTAGNDFNMFRQFLPSNTDDFYRYEGSLTTPNCYESVLWTVYRQPVPIAASQLTKLRRLKFTDGSAMVDNFRPPLPLNPGGRPGTPRTLYRTFSSANHVLPAGLTVALLTVAMLLMQSAVPAVSI